MPFQSLVKDSGEREQGHSMYTCTGCADLKIIADFNT